jgi:hypothetical protein
MVQGLSVLLRFTDSDYPFGKFKLFFREWGTEDEDKQNRNTNTEQCVGHHGNNHKEHK